MTDRRVLLLHIGASKTGTSAFQVGMRNSVDALAAQGIGVPLPGREANASKILRPLGWTVSEGFVRPVEQRRLARLTNILKTTEGSRLLLTNEDLCEADAPRIKALAEVIDEAGLDVRVLLSARNLAAIIPSEWQQFIKHRLTTPYPQFLDDVRARRGRWADHFWQRQDTVAIADRWADVVGAENVEVVVTPNRGTDPNGLYTMFGAIIGFDWESMSWPTHDVNASWGYTEADLYRRINEALGDRLPDYQHDYQPAVRTPLAQGALARGASDRITLPPEHLDWVRAQAIEQRDGLLARDFVVHGDPDLLVPAPDSAVPLPPLDEAAVAAAAVATMANLVVFNHRRMLKRSANAAGHPGEERSDDPVGSTPQPADPPASSGSPAMGSIGRRVARRVRSRRHPQ